MKIKIGENEHDLSEIQTALSKQGVNSFSKEDIERIKTESEKEGITKGHKLGFSEAMDLTDSKLSELGFEKPADTKTVDFLSQAISTKTDVDVNSVLKTEREKARKEKEAIKKDLEESISKLRKRNKSLLIDGVSRSFKFKEDLPKSLLESHKKTVVSELMDEGISFEKVGNDFEMIKEGKVMRGEDSKVITLKGFLSSKHEGLLIEESKGTGVGMGIVKSGNGKESNVTASNKRELLNSLKEKHGSDRAKIDEEYKELSKSLPA